MCKPEPLAQMNGLQRVVECLRYTILCLEHWLSPAGHIREWLRRNLLLGAWLIVPALFVMPVIGLILWQLTGWLNMLTGHLLILPILFLFMLRTVFAFLKR